MKNKLGEYTTERAADQACAAYNAHSPLSAYVKRTGGMKRRWSMFTDYEVDPATHNP